MLALVLATASVVAACGGESRPAADAARSTTAPASASTAPTEPTPTGNGETSEGVRRGRVIDTADSAYGSMLFDQSGQAIYLFDAETTSTPQCYGACAEAWPPVLAGGLPQPRGAVRPGLLDTTLRKDGSRQVTYAGHPLYFYAHEGKHEVLCHNVFEYGGLWLVVTPGGEPAA